MSSLLSGPAPPAAAMEKTVPKVRKFIRSKVRKFESDSLAILKYFGLDDVQ